MRCFVKFDPSSRAEIFKYGVVENALPTGIWHSKTHLHCLDSSRKSMFVLNVFLERMEKLEVFQRIRPFVVSPFNLWNAESH